MNEKPRLSLLNRCFRLYRLAFPHWKLILASTLAMMVYTATYGGFLVLVNPIINGVQGASQEAGGQVADPARSLTEDETPEGGKPGLRQNVERSIRGVARRTFIPDPEQFRSPATAKRVLVNIAVVMGLFLAPLLGFSAFLQLYLRSRVQWLIIGDIREQVFSRLVVQPLTFFDRHRVGDLISRMTTDITVSQVALQFLFGEIILGPMKILAGLGVAVYTSWQLSLICFLGLPVIVIVLKHFGGKIHRNALKSLQKIGDLTDTMNQMLGGIRVVKAFQLEKAEQEEFARENRKQLRQAFRLVKNRALAAGIPEFLYAAGAAVIIFIGTRLLGKGNFTLSEMGTFAGAAVFISQPIRQLAKGYSRLQEALAASDRLFDLIDLHTQEIEAPDAVAIDGVSREITFDKICFAYEGEQHVLEDISFTAPAGKVIAIIGETGAGKSTLLDLIPRFHDPDRGSIRIDGNDTREIKRKSLIAQVAVVGQSPFLFNRSILSNIRYGRLDATAAEIENAAVLAGIHDFVVSLPQGYDTAVGERGSYLSGGQRQCITIARAILKNAPILILDEATSNLDASSEQLVHRALSNLMKGRTTFVIAHRLNTVRRADLIVVLKNGRVVEQGRHDELIRLKGEYHRLYTIQFQPEEEEKC